MYIVVSDFRPCAKILQVSKLKFPYTGGEKMSEWIGFIGKDRGTKPFDGEEVGRKRKKEDTTKVRWGMIIDY